MVMISDQVNRAENMSFFFCGGHKTGHDRYNYEHLRIILIEQGPSNQRLDVLLSSAEFEFLADSSFFFSTVLTMLLDIVEIHRFELSDSTLNFLDQRISSETGRLRAT